ncbi:hypothetical protein BDV97DRAFT_362003 [Delphinella strobiligena]|nr:hypothetical protein BDV97DRAFT_362003 [Delphinella strobiligena]
MMECLHIAQASLRYLMLGKAAMEVWMLFTTPRRSPSDLGKVLWLRHKRVGMYSQLHCWDGTNCSDGSSPVGDLECPLVANCRQTFETTKRDHRNVKPALGPGLEQNTEQETRGPISANCGRTGDRKIQRCRSCARMRRITFDDPSSGLGGRLSVRSVCRHSEGTFHRELFETTEMTVLWDSILLRRGKGQESMNP